VASALGGHWVSDRSWIERLGRSVGAAWLGLFLLGQLAIYL
jgi:hypothetical protein